MYRIFNLIALAGLLLAASLFIRGSLVGNELEEQPRRAMKGHMSREISR